MKSKTKTKTYNAPVIWLLGLPKSEKDVAKQVLSAFEEAKHKFCTVDFNNKKLSGSVGISVRTVNMSDKEGKIYYDHVYEQLNEMGFNVE